jgi:hypothetical protein
MIIRGKFEYNDDEGEGFLGLYCPDCDIEIGYDPCPNCEDKEVDEDPKSDTSSGNV